MDHLFSQRFSTLFLPTGMLCLLLASGCGNWEQEVGKAKVSKDTPDLGKIAPLAEPWDSDSEVHWEVAEIMAGLSNAAYLDGEQAAAAFRELGFEKSSANVSGSMVSYIVSRGPIAVVVFRGTDDLEDWLANVKVHTRDVAGGSIHSGFYDAYQTLRSKVHEDLDALEADHIWITGHSLGGALAVACAHDLTQSKVDIHGLVTFGQPMLAKTELAADLSDRLANKYQRFVNAHDVVPRIPPLYAHTGSIVWFNSDGITRSEAPTAKRLKDNLAGGDAPFGPPAISEEAFQKLQERLKQMSANSVDSVKDERSDDSKSRLPFPPIDDHGMAKYIERIGSRGAAPPRDEPPRPNLPTPPGPLRDKLPTSPPDCRSIADKNSIRNEKCELLHLASSPA
jgi:pimeloyl-ACP methyl ester carboxylesterase